MKRFWTFRSIVLVLTVVLVGVSGPVFAAPDVSLTSDGKVPGGPFVYLQEQIDNIQLTPGPQGPAGPEGPMGPQGLPGDQAALTPPVVIHDAPATISAYELALAGGILAFNITVTDDAEVAYYVISDYSQPANNGWFIVDAGQSAVTFTLENSSLQNGLNRFMVMAADMQGSISKTLIEVDADVVICSNRVPGANLTGCNFDYENLTSMNLSGANLTLASMIRTNLTYANLSNADLTMAELTSATLSRANLSGATLINANLHYATIYLTNLAGADLSGANLNSTNMTSAILTNAVLRQADLKSANLYNTDFSHTDLSLADATGAFLHNVDLTGANLTGAKFDWFPSNTIWSNTICPDGSNSDIDDGDGQTCNNNLIP